MDEAQRRWDDAQARFERERDALERERLAYDQARARFDRNRARSAAYDGPTWAGPNGEVHCRRSDGTTGTIIGGVAGALLGRAIDGGRRSAVGTILGGGAGALAGRSIERGRDAQCR
ncbi:glycine zipper 2TM domain-containing protein [Sphingomonas changnyeongensis]|uniref:17 kDa surface antigen n=2 Tax=Sphingomonas changnyeongensis TaxID=2698679 RepID=A0A7Z2NXP4_9SPHN|nr:glycine zipper 2TM domain-containing protein [Sphingomonas changnyeongensis]